MQKSQEVKEAVIVFPFQLFDPHPALEKATEFFLVEEWLLFHQFPFHKQKLVLHRASMQAYAIRMRERDYRVNYVPATEKLCDVRLLIDSLADDGFNTLRYVDVVDDWLERRISTACNQDGIRTLVMPTPYFLNEKKETDQYFDGRKRYFQTDFYIDQRKKRQILIDEWQKPVGGSWTYDVDNRKKIPKEMAIPAARPPRENRFVKEAKAYVEANFSANYGSAGNFSYATTHEEAEKQMKYFFAERYEKFGVYQDAIVRDEAILFHSVLSPYLNTGLLTPQHVLDAALNAGSVHKIPQNSLEGFIRQIVGWREFMRCVYEREGGKQRTLNFWKFSRSIPKSFYDGTTGIDPLDDCIRKALSSGYLHHIERLMIVGNFMLLCEFDPDDVYQWFMELFVDAYDWVMVPNVYAMSQFGDGGMVTTKPYISGSSYIIKMSNYKKGEWSEIWDALFWRFMDRHRDFFSRNPRLGMLVRTFDKMLPEKRVALLTRAEEYLATLNK